MNKIISFCLICFVFLGAWADDIEKFSITINGVKHLKLPFALESYRLSPKNKVVVEEVSKTQIRIVGKEIGETNLTVTGAGITKDYIITVKSNIGNVLKRLRSDLDSLPELDLSINDNYIVIRGTVSNPTNWQHLQKVLPLYGNNVHNFAVFQPAAETILDLKKVLTESGFTFAQPGAPPKPGELSLVISSNNIVISGELYSKDSKEKVIGILKMQPWLAIDNAPDMEKGQIQGIVNLSVMETVLQVDIVYVGITETEAKNLGTGSPPTAQANFGILYDLITGRGTGKNAQFGGNMEATVQFLASNGVTRKYQAGHVSFANGGTGTLHTGGTISVKVSGVENGSLQDIDYGLNISVTGELLDARRTRLKLSLTNTSAVTADGDSYTREVDTTTQTVLCDLDKTVVVAGSRKISQLTQKSGLPILRNTPVLNWFVSGDVDSENDTRLLILACPRLVKFNPDVQIDIPLEQETTPVYRNARRDNNERIEEEKRYRGWLSWLNWFCW